MLYIDKKFLRSRFLFVFEVLSAPFWNIRSFFLACGNIRNFLRVGVFHFLTSEIYFLKYKKNIRVESSFSGNMWKFRYAMVLNIPFQKYKTSFVMLGFWIFLSRNIRKFRFWKYKKDCLLRKYQKVPFSEVWEVFQALFYEKQEIFSESFFFRKDFEGLTGKCRVPFPEI